MPRGNFAVGRKCVKAPAREDCEAVASLNRAEMDDLEFPIQVDAQIYLIYQRPYVA